jgi:hypothetical protein
MKRERVPLSQTELPIRTASYPAIPEPSMSHGEYTKTTGFGGDKKPLVRAALHAAPEAVVPLYRSQEVNRADEDAVEFGTRIPEVMSESSPQPRDFPIRKNPFFYTVRRVYTLQTWELKFFSRCHSERFKDSRLARFVEELCS